MRRRKPKIVIPLSADIGKIVITFEPKPELIEVKEETLNARLSRSKLSRDEMRRRISGTNMNRAYSQLLQLLEEIFGEHNLSRAGRRSRGRPKWTSEGTSRERDDYLQKMFKAGDQIRETGGRITQSAVAEHLGCTTRWLQRKMSSLGIQWKDFLEFFDPFTVIKSL